MQHARGVWFRLERALAFSRTVLLISAADAGMLAERGFVMLAAGLELEPKRRLFVVPESDLPSLEGAREIKPRETTALLASPAAILVPFESVAETAIAEARL